MLTWRYHLMTLVAIFLALGLGMLVGISLSDSGVVETGRAGLVDDIQRDLDSLRSRNSFLERERAVNSRYQDDSFPFIVGGHLQGQKVALVVSSDVSDSTLRDINSALNSAGGQVISTTILDPRFDTGAAVEKIRNDLKADPTYAGLDEASLTPVLGQQLAVAIGMGGGGALLNTLQGTMVESTSGSYDIPVNSVLLLNRADDRQSPLYSDLEKHLLLNLGNLGVMPVGAEPADAPISEIPMFISIGVSSVDNIDTRIGQVSAVYVLGGEKGSFGVKTTADLLIPILRETAPGAPSA